MTTPRTVMPKRIDLGKEVASTIGTPMHQYNDAVDMGANPIPNTRTIMGYVIPKWQRPLVWTEAQMISFMESAWLGLPLGTYTYNRNYDNPEMDDILIDGQQRLYALQCYLDDKFPVFGYRWSEVTEYDRRRFSMTTAFHSYIMDTDDEQVMRDYYNMMNFGGTAHTEDQRA